MAIMCGFPAISASVVFAPNAQLQQLYDNSEFFGPSSTQHITSKVPLHRPTPWPSFMGGHAAEDEARSRPWPSFRETNDYDFLGDAVEKVSRRCNSDSSSTITDVAIGFEILEFYGNLSIPTGCIIIHVRCIPRVLRCLGVVPWSEMLRRSDNSYVQPSYTIQMQVPTIVTGHLVAQESAILLSINSPETSLMDSIGMSNGSYHQFPGWLGYFVIGVHIHKQHTELKYVSWMCLANFCGLLRDEHHLSACLDAKYPTHGVILQLSSAYAVLSLGLSGSTIIAAVVVSLEDSIVAIYLNLNADCPSFVCMIMQRAWLGLNRHTSLTYLKMVLTTAIGLQLLFEPVMASVVEHVPFLQHATGHTTPMITLVLKVGKTSLLCVIFSLQHVQTKEWLTSAWEPGQEERARTYSVLVAVFSYISIGNVEVQETIELMIMNTPAHGQFLKKEDFEGSGLYASDNLKREVLITGSSTSVPGFNTTVVQSSNGTMGSQMVCLRSLLGLPGLAYYSPSDRSCESDWKQGCGEFSRADQSENLALIPLTRHGVASLLSFLQGQGRARYQCSTHALAPNMQIIFETWLTYALPMYTAMRMEKSKDISSIKSLQMVNTLIFWMLVAMDAEANQHWSILWDPGGCMFALSSCEKCSDGIEIVDTDSDVIYSDPCDQLPKTSLRDRLGRVSMMDIESSNFSWSSLSSLHHTKHTSTSTEPTEDDTSRSFEVTVNSGGVVFIALFRTSENDEVPSKEAAAVIKIALSRMATQSERFGYELAKWLGVRTPQGRVIHSSSGEWPQIKDAVENARHSAIAIGDELQEMICTEMLEALELSRCLFLMNYVHGSPLLESTTPFDSREFAEKTAEALGRILILDLILRNEDRLRCRPLGWRGNYANLLVADKEAYANLDSLDDVHDSAIIRYKPEIIKSPQKQKQRRAVSISGSIGSDISELVLEDTYDPIEPEISSFQIVAIDSGVPRRPPAGKRVKDQENYPRLVELTLNNWDYSSNLLFEVSIGKLGIPGPEEFDMSPDYSYHSPLSESDMVATVNSFRGGFRSALRDLQRFHIFLLTLYQKLDALLKIFFNLMSKGSNESDKEDAGPSDSPLCSVEAHADLSDAEIPRHMRRPSRTLSRDSFDLSSPACRESFMTKNFKTNGDASRGLRLTMKLREFNKYAKVDSELSKEIEQWNDMLRTDVVKLCQDNNFNTGFFEGIDNSVAVDAYELKVRLEHLLERISLISDAASTERPSQITDCMHIGGALAARSTYTLQHLGITHVLCLCANEIGQSESQKPCLFDYRNFSINDDENADISDVFQDASDFIDFVEHLQGKVLVHCFEGKSRSATVVLAYLMLRKNCTLAEAWNMLKKAHRRAHPNDGFAKVLLDLDKRLPGRISMEWQHKRPAMKVCPICVKNAGLSSSSLKLHLQKSHRKISSGSIDSAMSLEIQKAMEAMMKVG